MANHPNRSRGTFAVIQPDSPNFGTVLSRHRTREAAEAAVANEERRFRRSRHGRGTAWLDREIVPCKPGAQRAARDGSGHCPY